MTTTNEPALDYQICSNCVMDTSDPGISFDTDGVCDHCRGFWSDLQPHWNPSGEGADRLGRLAEEIRAHGEGNDFDCILGMSGGLDSSYMLHLAVTEMGLNPLVFHVDGGWNSATATQNIERIVDGLSVDLYTEVINWREMQDFQLAFFKSGVPHIDIPQDHAFVAAMYNFALKHKVKYILNGGNISTECVHPPKKFYYYGTDMRQIGDVRKQFGTVEMPTYPWSGVLRHKLYMRYAHRMRVAKPLNIVPYRREAAIQTLTSEYDFEWYGQKHFESRFTKFYEAYWLPRRFGFDIRRSQFASLILTDQMTRGEAVTALESSALDPDEARVEFEYVADKLEISSDELKSYEELPLRFYDDYKNRDAMFEFGAKVLQRMGEYRTIKR